MYEVRHSFSPPHFLIVDVIHITRDLWISYMDLWIEMLEKRQLRNKNVIKISNNITGKKYFLFNFNTQQFGELSVNTDTKSGPWNRYTLKQKKKIHLNVGKTLIQNLSKLYSPIANTQFWYKLSDHSFYWYWRSACFTWCV